MMQLGILPAFQICGCGTQDAAELARLHAILFEAPWSAAGFAELMAHPGTLAFVARPVVAMDAEAPAAALGLVVGRVAADEAEILTLGVARGHRGLGIGARLVEKLCGVARRRGARNVYLEVAEGNGAARALYARLGFHECGRRGGYYECTGAPPQDAINLCRHLGSDPSRQWNFPDRRAGGEGSDPRGAAVDGVRGLAYKRPGSHAPHEDMSASEQPASRIEKLCADKRLRMTGQRRVIARVLSDAKDHPDVEEVHRRAHAVDARISLSTVYRTLRLFATKGILERHDFGAGRGRYEEAARIHHDHLIDLETGRVIEFSNEKIERLQQRVAQELGFQLVGHKLELYGIPTRRPRR